MIPFRKSKKGGRAPGGKEPTVRSVSTDEKEESDRWSLNRKPQSYTEKDKRLIMSEVLESATMATFNNHFYKWNNSILRQKKGGAIGLRATGSLARITMDQWLQEFRKLAERAGIEFWPLKKYVDDVLVMCTNLEFGSRLRGEQISTSVMDQVEDLATGMTPERLTMGILRELADKPYIFLEFTS